MIRGNVLVTGASSGIGKAIAERFLGDIRFEVQGISRTEPDIKHKGFKYIYADIKDYVSVRTAFDYYRLFGTKEINVFINNAGVFKQEPFSFMDTETIDNIIDTNLKGTIYCTKEALELMHEGHIINICSVAGKHGIPEQAVYCASKYGIRGFSEALAQEIKDKNIYITNIFLGGTDTPLWNQSNPYRGDVKELLTPEQIADIVYNVTQQHPNMIVKEITLFPSNEWH